MVLISEKMPSNHFPSIWLGDFSCKAEYDSESENLRSTFQVYDWLDDRILYSRHPFAFHAYCAACDKVTPMRIRWDGLRNGSSHPAWTETAVCDTCGLNSRMRALICYIKTRVNLNLIRRAYIAEAVTPSYHILDTLVSELVASEYLNSELKGGEMVSIPNLEKPIRHEDLTSLSFADGEFELAITQDVFEHIPNYTKAFSELARILSSNGSLVFTIPFFPNLATTCIRAKVGLNGIEHILPPEIHGNPVSKDGSLCFQNFGWDILTDLRNVGFSKSFASLYWGPSQGHLGSPFFIFSATKT